MSDDGDRVSGLARLCPMCRRPVSPVGVPDAEAGPPVHVECDLGLGDAARAIARLLHERPGHALCVECIALALSVTPLEAEIGGARLRPLRGFDTRFDVCVGCGARRRVVRALRADLLRATRSSRTA